MKKYARQEKILKIIRDHDVETQEDLTKYLRELGIDITQATISRDIKELGLVKVMGKNGKYRYASFQNAGDGATERLMKIFGSSIVSITPAGHLLVIKTIPGAAQVSASAVDALGIEEIIGTIAGDDTIFIAINDKTRMNYILDIFYKLIE
ncbi:MAG: arginine repressor [Tissierellales bacterium]|nr:arginine repressor [Tissierellales bacterium]